MGARFSSSPAGASWSATTAWRCGSHSGFSVETTNRMASATVTVCAKISHNLCMESSRMKREELVDYLDGLLMPGKFKDYCPNGLQVEGRGEIRCLVAGVTASQALLDAAVERNADAILVHHGYFWRGEDCRVTGIRRQRLATLLARDINLLAYHLPLDAHPELGNNAQLALRLGWLPEGRFGEQDIAWLGSQAEPCDLPALVERVSGVLGRRPLVVAGDSRPVRRIGWCSGGAQGYFEQAIALGVDAYLSGEISEQTVHLARESGVAYLAAGHHATERYGVQALAAHLGQRFGIACEFVDLDNPVLRNSVALFDAVGFELKAHQQGDF